eukprot:gene921-1164_t
METGELLLTRIMIGHWASQALKIAVQFKLADYFVDGPKSAFDIAKDVGADPQFLFRLMRALTTLGIFHQDEKEDHIFSQSELSEYLTEQNGWINALRFESNPTFYNGWNYLSDSIIAGRSMVANKMGYRDVWDMVKNDTEAQTDFHRGMATYNRVFGKCIVGETDFRGFDTVVDLGGSHGTLIFEILAQNPTVKKGVNFDLDYVISNNKKLDRSTIPQSDLDRYEEVVGNFFESVPTADCYTLKQVFHDWNDEKCISILQTISKSIPRHGKIYIFDTIIETKNQYSFSIWLDLKMSLFVPGGKERTPREWMNIAEKAGYRVESIQTLSNNINGRIILSKIF